jgi:hypothetical protein
MTGEPLFTGEYRKTGGFLLDGGFQYHAIKFDMTDDSFFGLPMMAYVEDEQNVIVDSVSRRADLLKRFPRLILGHRSERDENSQIADDISTGKDGTIAWVNDINNSFRIMDQGQVPQDQLGIESDMRNYEEQILQVSQLALGGGPSRRTATEASLIASFGQLNREWLQDKVAEVYRVGTYNNLRIMADPRYLPESFIVDVAAEDGEPVYQAITSDMLKVRFKIEVEANSMRPMFEQLEREDMLALFNYLIQIPEVDRMESIKMLLRAFKVPNQEKLIGRSSDAPEVRTAQLENQFMASRMQDPGVLMEQDHQAHMRTHAQASQDPGVTSFLQQAMQMNPQAVQMFQMLMQQHLQQHQQFMQRKAMGKTNKVMPSARDQAGMGDPNTQAKQLQNVVKSNAQRTSQTVGVNTEQN